MGKTWDKSPASHIAAFAEALPDDSFVERRQMFGYPCAFVNGNMFCGLHEANICVRLGEEQAKARIAAGAANVFAPMAGRVMKEYVAVPASDCADASRLALWLREAFAYTRALPGKVPKAPGEKKKK